MTDWLEFFRRLQAIARTGLHFARDPIPPLSIGRVTPKLIRRFFDHYRNPDWPADFD